MNMNERVEKLQQLILRIWWDGNDYAGKIGPGPIDLSKYADEKIAFLSTLGCVWPEDVTKAREETLKEVGEMFDEARKYVEGQDLPEIGLEQAYEQVISELRAKVPTHQYSEASRWLTWLDGECDKYVRFRYQCEHCWPIFYAALKAGRMQ